MPPMPDDRPPALRKAVRARVRTARLRRFETPGALQEILMMAALAALGGLFLLRVF